MTSFLISQSEEAIHNKSHHHPHVCVLWSSLPLHGGVSFCYLWLISPSVIQIYLLLSSCRSDPLFVVSITNPAPNVFFPLVYYFDSDLSHLNMFTRMLTSQCIASSNHCFISLISCMSPLSDLTGFCTPTASTSSICFYFSIACKPSSVLHWKEAFFFKLLSLGITIRTYTYTRVYLSFCITRRFPDLPIIIPPSQ